MKNKILPQAKSQPHYTQLLVLNQEHMLLLVVTAMGREVG